MNWAHLHLMINHLPVLGAPALLLLLAWALLRRSPAVARAALWGTVLLAPVAQLVSLTGEQSEERLEQVVALDEAVIEPHEEIAETATRVLFVGAILAAIALWRSRRGSGTVLLSTAVLAGLLAASGLMAYSAWTGGMIRHAEIRMTGMNAPLAQDQPADAERD
ncbi:MAG TPA: hypothetical protein VHJ69_08865 [Gemmatimonadales bacterium]|nr:hypothetical protein [Gemmatimonadales bacterium]